MLENKAKAMVSALPFNGCILSKTLKRSELATTSMQAPFYRETVGKQLISDQNWVGRQRQSCNLAQLFVILQRDQIPIRGCANLTATFENFNGASVTARQMQSSPSRTHGWCSMLPCIS